LKNKVKLMS